MKVALINNLYKPYARGGAEKVIEKIVNEYQKKGDNVFIITTAPITAPTTAKTTAPTNDSDKKQENIYYIKSFFHTLGKLPVIFRFFYHIYDEFNFINYFRIKKILKKENPDVIWTHNLKGLGMMSLALPRRLKIKHYHTLHDIQLIHPSGLMFYNKEAVINTILARCYQALNKFFIKSPDKIISPSKWLIELHRKNCFFQKSDLRVIPNYSIDNKKSNICNTLLKKDLNFLYVGQVEEHKGILMLVEVFVKLSCKNISLTVVGSGSLDNKIKKLAISNKKIKILGRKDNNEILDIMKKSDYLVVPSLCYENSPTVIYEASDVKLSVIASDIGGIKELINQVGGDLFVPDKESLEKIILSKIK